MYDLQIIVPCIKERLKSFQKYGLSNIGDTKLLVYCLVDNAKDFQEGWPDNPNLKIELVEYPECEDHTKCGVIEIEKPIVERACYKVFRFIHEMTDEQINQAKWTLKMDDDVYNDISEINYFLNLEYDSEKEFYLVGEVRYELHNCEVDILKKLNLWNKMYNRFEHEKECCYLSRAALRTILSNNICKELFREKYFVSLSRHCFTDQTMGAAAKICKIFPVITTSILSTGPDHLIPCILLSKKEKLSRDGIFRDRYFSHFHPLKEKQIRKLLEIEMRKEGKTEQEIREFFPTPTISSAYPIQSNPVNTPTLTRFWYFDEKKDEPSPTPTPTLPNLSSFI